MLRKWIGKCMIWVLVIGIQIFVPPVNAEDLPKLTVEQEAVLVVFTLEFADQPLQHVVNAKLDPPDTFYHVDYIPDDLKRWTLLEERFKSVGMVATLFFEETDSSAEITCGSFDPIFQAWTHEEGPPPKCAHEDGTSHVGTIKLKGFEKIYISVGGAGIFETISEFSCVYEGSESGQKPCVTKRVSWQIAIDTESIITPTPLETPAISDQSYPTPVVTDSPTSKFDDSTGASHSQHKQSEDKNGMGGAITSGIVVIILAGVGWYLRSKFKKP